MTDTHQEVTVGVNADPTQPPGIVPRTPSEPQLKKNMKQKKSARIPQKPVPTLGIRGFVWKYFLSYVYDFLGWNWIVPNQGLDERYKVAVSEQRRCKNDVMKVTSIWIDKGGVGKTTVSAILALEHKAANPGQPVLVQDCDLGTLADRLNRTTALSLVDAVDNMEYLRRYSDVVRYCSEVTPEGLLFMASTRRGQLTGIREVTKEEMMELHVRESDKIGIVFNDLAPNTTSSRNLGALEMTHQIVLVTTGAKDSITKAIYSLGWLASNGYGHLAENAIVVVNKVRRKRSLSKAVKAIRNSHELERIDLNTDNIDFRPMGYSFGLNRGGIIVRTSLPAKIRTQAAEIDAEIARRVADSFADHDETQLTHSEELEIQWSKGIVTDDDLPQQLTIPGGGE